MSTEDIMDEMNEQVRALKAELEATRAERNRIGMEVRREWMGKAEALAKERDALRKAVAEFVAAFDDQLGYEGMYSRRARALTIARAALKDVP